MKQVSEVCAVPNGSIAAFVERGRRLLEAKASLGHGRWIAMFRQHRLPFSLRSAEMWMAIAGHECLANSHRDANLPRSLNALYQLSRADQATVRHGIRVGTITPEMTTAAAKTFVEAFNQNSRSSPKTSSFNPQRRIAILTTKVMSESRSWPVEHRVQLALAVEDIANRILDETRKQQPPV